MRISDWSSDVCSSDLQWPDFSGKFHSASSRTPRRTSAAGRCRAAGRAKSGIETGLAAPGKAVTAFPEFLPSKCLALGLHLIGGTPDPGAGAEAAGNDKIGRAECRERVCQDGWI